MFIKRIARVHRHTTKEPASDFGLLYSLLVVCLRDEKCFELERLLTSEFNTNNSALPPLEKVELDDHRCPVPGLYFKSKILCSQS